MVKMNTQKPMAHCKLEWTNLSQKSRCVRNMLFFIFCNLIPFHISILLEVAATNLSQFGVSSLVFSSVVSQIQVETDSTKNVCLIWYYWSILLLTGYSVRGQSVTVILLFQILRLLCMPPLHLLPCDLQASGVILGPTCHEGEGLDICLRLVLPRPALSSPLSPWGSAWGSGLPPLCSWACLGWHRVQVIFLCMHIFCIHLTPWNLYSCVELERERRARGVITWHFVIKHSLTAIVHNPHFFLFSLRARLWKVKSQELSLSLYCLSLRQWTQNAFPAWIGPKGSKEIWKKTFNISKY